MLIQFNSQEGLSVLMFDEIAATLIRMMGIYGKAPGVVQAKDIPAALSNEERPYADDVAILPNQSTSERVHLATRAKPLIELLTNAGRCGGDVARDQYHHRRFSLGRDSVNNERSTSDDLRCGCEPTWKRSWSQGAQMMRERNQKSGLDSHAKPHGTPATFALSNPRCPLIERSLQSRPRMRAAAVNGAYQPIGVRPPNGCRI